MHSARPGPGEGSGAQRSHESSQADPLNTGDHTLPILRSLPIPVGAEESSTWSARPTDIADERRRTNDIDLDERRPTIKQRRNGPAAMPTTMNPQAIQQVDKR